MAAPNITPKTSDRRRTTRPRPLSYAVTNSEPPRKKLRYVPGGPGGGGRYVDDAGIESVNTVASRTRPARDKDTPAHIRSPAVVTRSLPRSLPRRERQTPLLPKPRYDSASAAATAMTQSEGYKPREERGWEEFHPDLDLDAEMMVFSAEEVDGRYSGGVTPYSGPGLLNRTVSEGGLSAAVDEALLGQLAVTNGKGSLYGGVPSAVTPVKRRVGRPPKASMLSGLGSPPAPRITPLPTHNPKEKLNLPKPNFKRVLTFEQFEQDKAVGINYVDKSLANIGFQESEMFVRPEKTYIRGGEGSIEEELDLELIRRAEREGVTVLGRVEYDMDEQDERWLEAINVERKAEGVEGIKPAIFEITITQIEKEWHALEKRIPKPNPKQPQTHRPRSSSAAAVNGEPVGGGEEQDTKCAICDDGDCENTNAIVFCDGCDLAVHQECYGVPFIPEGQWLCRKCQLIGRNTPSCIFCPNVDGAFKQTNTLRWAHLLCSLWIPEVSIANTTFMEPVTDIEKVPRQRWKLTCYICQQRMGACVQCANKNCFVAFHVTCGRRAHLFLKMKNQHGNITDQSFYKGFCDKHVPPDWRKEHDVDVATTEAKDFYRKTMRGRRWADSQQAALSAPAPQELDLMDTGGAEEGDVDDPLSAAGNNKRKKLALQKKIWRLPGGAPIVPNTVYEAVEKAMAKFAIRKRKEFTAEACKYWSLKREARRGAPLIKRFQAQMEAFTSMEVTRRNFAAMGAAGRSRLQRRIKFAEMLDKNMEASLRLCELITERERLKLLDAQLLQQSIDTVYFPIIPALRAIMEKAHYLDGNVAHSKHWFKEGLDAVQSKMDERALTTIAAFTIEFARAFSAVIRKADLSKDTQSAEPDATAQQKAHINMLKEKRNRGKRIISNLTPLFKDATQKECDLGKKEFSTEWKEIEAMLKECTEIVYELSQLHPNGHLADTKRGLTISNHGDNEAVNSTARNDGDVEMEDAGDGLLKDRTGGASNVEAADEAHDVPGLSNFESTNTSAHLDPLTPTQQENSLLAPMDHGGILWCVEPFSPAGTTLCDERWAGRDVLRGMSEELSEMDDDAMNDLMEMQSDHVDGDKPELLEPPPPEKEKPKPKPKRRRFR